MLAAVLAGCGSSAPAPAESTGNDASVPAAESSQAAETGSEETEAAQADPASLEGEFTYWTYTDLSLIHIWGEYWTKLQTALPTGTGPDVFWMNIGAPDYIEPGPVSYTHLPPNRPEPWR